MRLLPRRRAWLHPLNPESAAPTNMSSSTASLFAFDDLSSRQTLWFMNELVDLGRLETAYEAWVALEKTGIFRSAMAERWAEEEVCTDDMHPIERTHRMHRKEPLSPASPFELTFSGQATGFSSYASTGEGSYEPRRLRRPSRKTNPHPPTS